MSFEPRPLASPPAIVNPLYFKAPAYRSLASGQFFSGVPEVSGGTKPYTFALDVAPANGLSHSTATGAIEGTPSALTSQKFTQTVTDSSTPPQTVSRTFVVGKAPAVLGLGVPIPLSCPFSYSRTLFPFDFWRDSLSGVVTTSFDRKTWAPTPDTTGDLSVVTYYANIARADDSGDGLSLATAKKSINAAITAGNAQPNPYQVLCSAGTYPRGNSPSGSAGTVVPNKAVSLIAVGGRVVTGHFDLLGAGWTLDQGTTYKVTRGNSRRAIMLDSVDQDGLNPDYTAAADLTACRATPGSWWTDNTTVYVTHPTGAVVSDANTRIGLTISGGAVINMSTGGNMYVSGFDCQFSKPLALSSSPTNRFVAEDCTFRYSSGSNGIFGTTLGAAENGAQILGVLGAAFTRCDASANQADGLNSHIQTGVQAFVFTMDCTGFNNGRAGSTSNQYITTHDGGKWFDLRGIARRNAGGQVAIVNDNTKMWCIDTQASDSRGDKIYGGGVDPSDFLVDQTTGGADPVKLYLDNCSGSVSLYSLNARAGTIYTRGGLFPQPNLTAAGGQIISY